MPWPRLWCSISWAGGLLLDAFGGVNTVVALAVFAGLIRLEGGYDADAMMAHALPVGPAILPLGGALVLSWWLS